MKTYKYYSIDVRVPAIDAIMAHAPTLGFEGFEEMVRSAFPADAYISIKSVNGAIKRCLDAHDLGIENPAGLYKSDHPEYLSRIASSDCGPCIDINDGRNARLELCRNGAPFGAEEKCPGGGGVVNEEALKDKDEADLTKIFPGCWRIKSFYDSANEFLGSKEAQALNPKNKPYSVSVRHYKGTKAISDEGAVHIAYSVPNVNMAEALEKKLTIDLYNKMNIASGLAGVRYQDLFENKAER